MLKILQYLFFRPVEFFSLLRSLMDPGYMLLPVHCCFVLFIIFFTVKLVFGAIYLDWCILIFTLMVWKFKFEKKLYNKLLIWKRSHCFRDVRTVSKLISWKRPPRIDRSLRTHLDHLNTVIIGCLSAALIKDTSIRPLHQFQNVVFFINVSVLFCE